ASHSRKDNFMAELLAPLRPCSPCIAAAPVTREEQRPGVLGMDEPGSFSGRRRESGRRPETPRSHAAGASRDPVDTLLTRAKPRMVRGRIEPPLNGASASS